MLTGNEMNLCIGIVSTYSLWECNTEWTTYEKVMAIFIKQWVHKINRHISDFQTSKLLIKSFDT